MAALFFLFLSLQVLLLVSRTHGICDFVGPIQNGKITYFHSNAYYLVSCNKEYTLVGNPRVFCVGGEWNNHPPRCIEDAKTICEELLAPENGKVECTYGPLSVGKSCRITCFDGYKLKGSEIRNCMMEKKWSGIATECIPVSRTVCPLPQPLRHGSVVGCTSQSMPRINDKCSFQCNSGYILMGPSSLTCTPSGRYVDEEGYENFPECVVHRHYNGRPLYKQPISNYHHTEDQTTSSEIDRNPCKARGCQHICKHEQGHAWCQCFNGFTLASNQKNCIDQRAQYQANYDPHRGVHYRPNHEYAGSKPEAKENPCDGHDCPQICQIENGKAQCRCNRGFILNEKDQRSCDKNLGKPIHPANPCAHNNGGCQHKCRIARYGQIKCECFPGYELVDGKNCIVPPTSPPRVTCDIKNGGCEHSCFMRGHNAECSCRRGYELDVDRKHCIVPPTSPPRVTCKMSNGGCEHKCFMRGYNVECSCRRGYKLDVDRRHCIDINECRDERLNTCHHDCVNTEGGYTCHCRPGYVMIDNHKCEGCRKNSYWSFEKNGCVDCPVNSYTASEGKSSVSDCVCNHGFTGSPKDNIPCLDIDECIPDNFGCSHTCVNIPGHAFCSCPLGYTVDKDNKTCIDIDECSIKNGGCEGDCFNTEGSFHCKCPKGYVSSDKDQYSCDDIDECLEDNGGCHQLCVNYRGGFHCACENGYRLDSSLSNCTDITCPALPIPHFSTMICKQNGVKLDSMDSYSIGTTCTFNCFTGFKDASETNKMKCQDKGTWKGSLSQCKPQRCPALNVPENGDIHPSSCSTEGNTVKGKCTFTCRRGYKLNGPASFTCKNNLTWNLDVNLTPVCEPEETRVSISCSRDIIEPLPAGKSSQNITIPEPVTNMKNYQVDPENISVGKPVEFEAGKTKVVFTASSPNSNRTAKCVTIVHVVDEEPPVFISCPDDITIENAKIDGEVVTWDEPEVTDNVRVESLTSSVKPNTTLTPGSYIVEYFATDPEGNIANCSFNIDIIRLRCDNLADPSHGEANCMDWLYGKLCQPLCEEGYIRNPSDPPYYSCGDSGLWEPSDIITDCLPFTEAVSSECSDGSEFKIIEETEEEICLECPSDAYWSPATRTCE